eukprot:1157517-Pelagomonas_calceolata.AAC.12
MLNDMVSQVKGNTESTGTFTHTHAPAPATPAKAPHPQHAAAGPPRGRAAAPDAVKSLLLRIMGADVKGGCFGCKSMLPRQTSSVYASASTANVDRTPAAVSGRIWSGECGGGT